MLGKTKLGLYMIEGSTHHHYVIEDCLWVGSEVTTLTDGSIESMKPTRIYIPYDSVKLVPFDVWESLEDKADRYSFRANRKDYLVKNDRTLVVTYPKFLEDSDVIVIKDVSLHDYGSKIMWCVEVTGV